MRSIKPSMGVKSCDPHADLLDEERIRCAIFECFKNGDFEGVIEMISIYKDLSFSDFDDFLKEEGIFEQAEAEATKRILIFILEEEIKNRTSADSEEEVN